MRQLASTLGRTIPTSRFATMFDAIVEIHEYNPEWPALFADERRRIADALGKWLIGAPEHIGSTAVPGLAAKPIIDIMAPVTNLEASVEAIAAAKAIGYMYAPYKPETMHWFCKPNPAKRTHHLHLVPRASRLWCERLAFRNALRSSSELRAKYQSLKLQLVVLHSKDREAYTEAKTPFIIEALQSVHGHRNSAA